MNESKIDKLFQDKLASFEMKPPITSWEKVERNIQQKRNKKQYWLYAIAASLALVFTSAIIWINNDSSNMELQVAEIAIEESITPALQPEFDESSEQLSAQESHHEPSIISEDNSNQTADATGIPLIASTNKEATMSEAADNIYQLELDLFTLEKQGPEISINTAQLDPDFYFIPGNDLDLALPKNEPGIRKAYDFALRVKNGEESLIDLRKAKEDLFAMAKNIKFNNQSKPN